MSVVVIVTIVIVIVPFVAMIVVVLVVAVVIVSGMLDDSDVLLAGDRGVDSSFDVFGVQ